MKFNLKNYKYYSTYKIEKPEKGIGLEVKEDSLFDYQLQLPEIINELNNSKLLNIESKEEIPIIFENFSWLKQAKTTVNNFVKKTIGQEVFEHSIAHYKPKSKTIHIFNNIFQPTINNEQFRKELKEIKYYTFNNLDIIIQNYKNNNLNFSNNKELLNYININTNNELKIRLKENLENMLNSVDHNGSLWLFESII